MTKWNIIMRKINLFLLSCVLLVNALALSVSAAENITVTLNGVPLNFDVAPQIINDRTMVPMRVIFEALGYKVSWNADKQTVTANTKNNRIALQVNNATMNHNNNPVALDTAPIIIDDRMLVPVRAVAEGSGCKVEWNNTTHSVVIATKRYTMDTLAVYDNCGNYHEMPSTTNNPTFTIGYNTEFMNNPYTTYSEFDYYYVDLNTNINKIDLRTGESTIIANLKKELQTLSDNDDIYSNKDNIYMEGADIVQIAYDKYGKRLFVVMYLKQPRALYTFVLQNDGTLLPIIPNYHLNNGGLYTDYIAGFLPNNRLVTYLGNIVDISDGEVIDNTLPKIIDPYGYSYNNNKIFFSYLGALCSYDFKEAEIIEELGTGITFHGDFVYAYDRNVCYDARSFNTDNSSIRKYNLSGELVDKFGLADIEFIDGRGFNGIWQLLFCNADGDLIYRDDDCLRIIRKYDTTAINNTN